MFSDIFSDEPAPEFSEGSGPEAKGWLRANQNRCALAANRFGSTKEALEFVEGLYSAGARRVIIPQDSIQDDDRTREHEGGPYADALVVLLDPDADAAELLRLYREETAREGLVESFEEPPWDGKWLYFWWD